MIDVTLLGTAALFPLPDRALTAVFLTCGGHSILFDCGEGTQTAARKARVSIMKTDLIALTHYHGDHVFGLPGLLQTMHSFGRARPLYITGPAGLREALAPLLYLAGETCYEVRLLEAHESTIPLTGFPAGAALTSFLTEHRVPSQGYCFTLSRPGKFLPERAQALGVPPRLWGILQRGESVFIDGSPVSPEQVLGPPRRGLKLVFTGDTAVCDGLRDAARGADLLISEATFADDGQAERAREYGHMVFSQAARLAAEAGVRELWLAHYSQMVKDPQAALPNARAYFENTVCGADGMTATLRFS